MTRERLNYLTDLVDEVNEKVYVSASIEHGLNEDNIFVSLFYQGYKQYVGFCTKDYSMDYDHELERGEAFLKGLLAEAQANSKARREMWDCGVYKG